MTSFFGIVLDKRAYDGNAWFEVTAIGTEAQLKSIKEHHDQIAAFLTVGEWKVEKRHAVTLRNNHTTQAEPGHIYHFSK